MTASELFSQLSPATAESVVTFLYEYDRVAYRKALALLANRRNLRTVFLEKKPKTERHRWMAEALGRKRNEDLALEILQNWVLRANSEMVLQFLKDLDIQHDGEGIIETLPAEPAADVVDAAVNRLFEKFPAENVRVYLHLFAAAEEATWPHLHAMLNRDERLCRAEPANAPSATEPAT